MNHIYRIVFNRHLGLWQAVAETAKTRSKRKAGKAAALAGVALLALVASAQANTYINTTGNIIDGAGGGNHGPISISDALYIGLDTTADLTIQNGGQVSSGNGYVGIGSGSNGTVTVTGNGSNWTSTGVLMVGGGAGVTGALTISNGATVWNTSFVAIGVSSGTGSVSISNGGVMAATTIKVTDTRANDIGTLTLDNGTLRATGSASDFLTSGSGVSTVTIASGGATIDSNGYDIGISAPLTGTGRLTKSGTGTLTLTGNSSSGSLYLGGGKLVLDVGKLNLNAGSVIGYNGNAGELTIKNGGQLISASGSSSVIGADSGSIASATVTGTGSLWNVGDILNMGLNDAAGTLNLDAGGTLETAAIRNGSGTASLNFTGGVLRATADQATFFQNSGTDHYSIVLGTGGGTIDTNGHNIAIAPVFTGSGSLTKTGTGTLTLTGVSTYTGATAIEAGTLSLSGAGSLAASAGVTLANTAGATFDISATSSGATIKALSGGGAAGGNVVLGAQALTIDQSTNTTFAGSFSGAGRLTKSGTGTLTLTGANTLTGSTGDDVLVTAGGLVIDGGSLTLSNSFLSGMTVSAASGTANLTLQNGGTVDINGINGITVGKSSGSGILAITGSGSHLNAIAGTTNIGNNGTGTLSIASGGAVSSRTVVIGSGSTAGNATATLSGAGSTLTATSGEDHGGSVGLAIGVAGATGTLTIADGALATAGNTYLAVQGGNATLNLNGTSGSRGVLLTDSVEAGYQNTFTPGSTARLVFDGGILRANADTAGTHPGDFLKDFTSGKGTITINGGGAFLDTNGHAVSTAAVFGGTGAFTKQGAGTLTLSGESTYTGATTIESGTLALSGTGSIATSSGVTLANTAGAALDISATTSGATLKALSGGGAAGGNVVLGAQTLTLDQAVNTTYAGVISGAGGSLTKTGAGTLILNGANTYTGTTTVSGGTLEVGDINTPTASITSNVTVNAVGTLRGHGTVIGDVANNGTVAPGGSIGTLTVNGNYTQTGALAIEVSPTAASKLVVNGNATLGGTLAITYDPGTYTTKTYTLVQANAISGAFATTTETGKANIGSLTSTVSQTGTTVDLALAGNTVVAPTQTGIYSALGTSALFGAQSANTALLDRLGAAPASGFSVDPWATLTGNYISVGGNSSTPGFQSQRYGFLGGHDKTLDNGTTVGLAFGYDHTELSQHGEASSGKADTVRVAAYGSRAAGPVGLSATVGVGLGWLGQKRRFATGTAEGDHLAREVTAGIQAMLPLHLNEATTLTPKLGLRYAYFRANSYTEHGAGGQNLSVGIDDAHSLQPYAGITLDCDLGDNTVNKGTTSTMQVRGGYAHEVLDTNRGLSIVAQDGTPFAVAGVSLPRSYLTAGLGLTLHSAKNLDVALNYDALINTNHASSQQGSMNITYKF